MKSPQVIRFGHFEAHLETQTLYKRGRRVALQEKPFQLLVALLERAGELITREQLRERLWSADTFVEFDEGMNAAVAKLRYALGDSSDHPVFVETVRGKGYRWLAPVSNGDPSGASEILQPNDKGELRSHPDAEKSLGNQPVNPDESWERHSSAGVTRSRFERYQRTLLATALVGIAGGGFWYMFRGSVLRTARPTRSNQTIREQQLTTNSTDNPVSANAISPDGKYLAYADQKGLHLKLLATGEVRDIANPAPYKDAFVQWGIPQNWFPDSTHFIVNTGEPYQPVGTWITSILGQAPRKVGDTLGPWAVSPTGAVAFSSRTDKLGDREMWIQEENGGSARKVLEVDATVGLSMLTWSPDGRRIAFIREYERPGEHGTSIDSIDLRTNAVTTAVPARLLRDVAKLPAELRTLVWLPDGRLLYSSGIRDLYGWNCNFWQIRINQNSGVAESEPAQLTHWHGFCVLDSGVTADGAKLIFQKTWDRRTAYVAHFDDRQIALSAPVKLTDQQAVEYPTGWSTDGKTILFASNRNGRWEIFRQEKPDAQAEVVATDLEVVFSRTPITPDGLYLLNVERAQNNSGETGAIWKIPLSGGAAQKLTEGTINGVECSKNRCIYGEESADAGVLTFRELNQAAAPHRGSELIQLNLKEIGTPYSWSISPSGTTLAIAKQFDRKITIVDLSNRSMKILNLKNAPLIRNINWSANGKGLFASHPTKEGSALLYLDLQGNARTLWTARGQNVLLLALPSPDGKRLAIQVSSTDDNVWMIQNF
jgi:DNA-binding winged helix-turn-helix (wHTH) protein/Tol biopolymer transport system component